MNHVCKHTLSLHVVLFSVWDLLLYIRCSIKYREDTIPTYFTLQFHKILPTFFAKPFHKICQSFPLFKEKKK